MRIYIVEDDSAIRELEQYAFQSNGYEAVGFESSEPFWQAVHTTPPDLVILDDKPSKLGLAIHIAKKTMGIARQNIVFALAVKFACLILGALGIANMWTAIFADVGVMVIAVLNATRALYTKDLAKKNEE